MGKTRQIKYFLLYLNLEDLTSKTLAKAICAAASWHVALDAARLVPVKKRAPVTLSAVEGPPVLL